MKRMWNGRKISQRLHQRTWDSELKMAVGEIKNTAGEYQDIARRRCNQCHTKDKEEEQEERGRRQVSHRRPHARKGSELFAMILL
jgi:hypothetical protein